MAENKMKFVKLLLKQDFCRKFTDALYLLVAKRKPWLLQLLALQRQTIELNRLDGMTEEHFTLHYNFPPYSVGEVGQLKSRGVADWSR